MIIPLKFKANLSQIRSDLMEKIAEGPGEVANYVTFTLIDNGFTEEDCDNMLKIACLFYKNDSTKTAAGIPNISISKTMGYASDRAEEVKSVAGAADDVVSLITKAFGKKPSIAERVGAVILKHFPIALGAGILGAVGAKSMLQKKKEQSGADRAYSAILEEKPDLSKDPNLGKYYQTIRRFAPTLASDKHILESALEHAHEYGRLDYPMMKELIDMQTGVVGKPTTPLSGAQTVSGILQYK